MMPASLDFCRANLNPDNSSGTSIPSDNLKPTARLDPVSYTHLTLPTSDLV